MNPCIRTRINGFVSAARDEIRNAISDQKLRAFVVAIFLLQGVAGCTSSPLSGTPAAKPSYPPPAQALPISSLPAPPFKAPLASVKNSDENASLHDPVAATIAPEKSPATAKTSHSKSITSLHQHKNDPQKKSGGVSIEPTAIAPTASQNPAPNLVEASLAHNVPTQMRRGHSYPVDLWLNQNLSEEALSHNMAVAIRTNNSTSDAIHTGRLIVESGNEVVAELIVLDSEFKVSPSKEISQTVRPNTNLRWQWLIEPLKTGSLTVQIRVVAKVHKENSGVSMPYTGTVTVSAWPGSFSEGISILMEWVKQVDGLLALFGTSVAAAIAYFLKKRTNS